MDVRVERPVPFQGDLRSLPEALAALKEKPNWVGWRLEWRPDKNGGYWTKPPLQPKNPRQRAKNNDPATWGTYAEALIAFETGKCDGIGFNLSGTDIAAFDIDKCRDPVTGDIAPEAMAIVDRATSYTEMTVSGTGLRVVDYGTGAKTHRKQKIPSSTVEIESYRGAERYIVITGNPLPQTWPHMADIDAEIDAVVAELDGCKDKTQQDLDDEFAFKPQQDKTNTGDTGDAFLPSELIELIENPPQGDLSAEFHHAVCWLGDCGWSAERIEARIAGKPIVPARYAERLAQEIARCLHKRKAKTNDPGTHDYHDYTDEFAKATASAGQQPQPPFELFWHGKKYDRELRPWLVKELIPETGHGLASGQWGMAKSFVVLDLAASIMTATAFAGRKITRRGGVVFVAAEGASEMPIRLEGVVEQKLRPALGQARAADPKSLPFAWIEDCPNLQNKDDFARLLATVKQAAQNILDQFNLPLALIVIDTLNAVGNFKDGNDASESQFIMNLLGELSRQTGAFVLAVDHFGKAVETGTRGSSAKEAAADVVLALLGERDTAGNISSTRMAVRKLRGGKVGTETPFDLNVVTAGFGQTTCVVEWKKTRTDAHASTAARDRWPKSLRIFKSAVETTIIDHGKAMRPFSSGPEVRAVRIDDVRDEFIMAYPADADDVKARMHAKRMAFTRALNLARDKELICSREIGGVDYLWLVEPGGPT